MTASEAMTPEALEEARAAWRATVKSVISYRYLGTFSTAVSRHEAIGEMKIRPDMRGPVGLMAAPLGVALNDTAGINIDAIMLSAPTRIDVHLFEPGADVLEVRLEGRLLREGRSQFFTESRFTDAGDPSRLIAIGGTHWSVGTPNPGFNYVDCRPLAPTGPDFPPLYEPFGGRLRGDGNLEIPEDAEDLGGNGGLHQGPFQVVTEAAAMMAAQKAASTDQLWIEHQGTSIIARGSGRPLVTHAEVLRIMEGCINVRVELRAEGAGDRLLSVTMCRFRLL